MTIAVKIESPVGTTLQTRNFQPGQRVRVGGHVTGALSIGEPFTHVRMELTGDGFYPLFEETRTNFLGDFWFDIIMPWTSGKANLQFIATFSLLGQDVVDVPIAIGNVYPDPTPLPPPQGTLPSLPDLGIDIDWNLIGIAGLVILGIVLAVRKK